MASAGADVEMASSLEQVVQVALLPESDHDMVSECEVEARKSSRWKLLGAVSAAITLLLGSLAMASWCRAPGRTPLESSKMSTQLALADWEKIPGMDKVIAEAKALKHRMPLRNLEDVVYSEQPGELPWIRTQCVIDTVQAQAYLGQAIVFLYKAIDYDGLECTENTPAGCATSIIGFITSIAWVASYLSLAASSCAQSVNSDALCSADWTALISNFGEISFAGAAVHSDCDFSADLADLKTIHHGNHHGGHHLPMMQAGAGPVPREIRGRLDSSSRRRKVAEVISKLNMAEESARNLGSVPRGFDIAQCVFNVQNSASYIVRAILQIRTAASSCDDPRDCAINIMNVISSFAWITQFTSLAVSDCAVDGNQRALCGADIADMVAACNSGPAAGMAALSDCQHEKFEPDQIDELKRVPER